MGVEKEENEQEEKTDEIYTQKKEKGKEQNAPTTPQEKSKRG